MGSPASSPTTLARTRRGEPRAAAAAAASAARETTRRPATGSRSRIPSDDDDDDDDDGGLVSRFGASEEHDDDARGGRGEGTRPALRAGARARIDVIVAAIAPFEQPRRRTRNEISKLAGLSELSRGGRHATLDISWTLDG